MTNPLLPANVVETIDNRVLTTSLSIAETFGKRHDNVLRDIEELDCSAEFHLLNFEEMVRDVQIGSGAIRQDRYFEITKDGFTFLAMGYRGKKAAQFKEAYIARFNEMERALREQPAPTDLSAAIQAAIDNRVQAAVDAKFAALQAAPQPVLSKAPANLDGPDSSVDIFSMTESLRRHGSDMSAVTANKVMVACGWMVERNRVMFDGRSVQYKELVEDGLAYGANVVNYKNEAITTPYYYENSFSQLLELIDEHKHLILSVDGLKVNEMSHAQRQYYKDSGEQERRKREKRERARERCRKRLFDLAKGPDLVSWRTAAARTNPQRHFTLEERLELKAEYLRLQESASIFEF